MDMRERETVLVVDDTPANIDLLKELLRDEYSVKVALDGERALKIALVDDPPDIILLDVMMPGMDGYEVCRILKEDPRTRKVPVIFVTAKDETEDEMRGFELGAADYITKPVSPPLVKARVRTQLQLYRTSEDLERSFELIKKMFGRYLSTEVMNSLLEDPTTLELGGEKRKLTIMMTDLRGFTALSEQLKPEQVVQMLNLYFEVMVEVVLQYQGTINEIIGDALLVVFGAPREMPDRAQRAVACAIEMQNAMDKVNERNREQGLPELEMGIGLNETEVIVGNVGSAKRSKYTVVGSGVNMTSRIESYTVGGQILVSESVRQEAGDVLRIDAQRDVLPKGAETSLRIYEVGGIAGRFKIALEAKEHLLVPLARQIPIRYKLLEGKDIGKEGLQGSMVRLSKNCAEIALNGPVAEMTNLQMNLEDVDESLSAKDFYGKVVRKSEKSTQSHVVCFTSVPPPIDAYFQAFRQLAT